MRFLAYFAWILLAGISPSVFAHAQTPLFFNTPKIEIPGLNLNGYELAAIDLNDDKKQEFIIKSITCYDYCDYKIIAQAQDAFIEIGALKTRELRLGSNKNQGVYDLLAYNDHINDYRADLYRWEPMQSRYILKQP